jgi:hypothetical protein
MNKEKKIQKKFFKSENERNIWIRLNAELVQYTQKVIWGDDLAVGDINTSYSSILMSNNQLTYDEYECDAPRFSLEELLLIPIPELFKMAREKEMQEIRKMFQECEENNEENF